jgi:cardiolipin synthase
MTPGFQMPDGRGSLFDVLDRAAGRGLDVRVIFWRPNPEGAAYGPTFSGSEADREMLRGRGSRLRIRWDRAHAAFCQHQKSWLIDAGQSGETAFVGGINLNARAVVTPGHTGNDHVHDLYVEVAGPSASDVHHSFVQRWNEASDRAEQYGGAGNDGTLTFPACVSASRGTSVVQIQRTVAAGLYSDGSPSPAGYRYNIAEGERSIFRQYLLAIEAARSSIYIENQALPIPPITTGLEQALKRGLEVVMLLPAVPDPLVAAARREPENAPRFAQFASLGNYERFALAGIAGRNAEGGRSDVYVHSKLMIVDDAWATMGSCNLHAASLFDNTEMNASFWDALVARSLRCELLGEHLGLDTKHLDDRAALAAFREIAQENRLKREAGDFAWKGLAFSLDPATYAE